MNSLSWMIYLADVAGSVKSATSVILVGSLVAAVLVVLFLPLIAMEFDEAPALLKKCVKPFLISIGATLFLYAVTPSTNTIYAIAASEMGAEVLKSSTATKAQKALDAWLDKQIGEKPEKEEK